MRLLCPVRGQRQSSNDRSFTWGIKTMVTLVVGRPISKCILTTYTRLHRKWSNYTARKRLPLLKRWVGIKMSLSYHFTIFWQKWSPDQLQMRTFQRLFICKCPNFSTGKRSSCTVPALHFQKGFLILVVYPIYWTNKYQFIY